MITNFAAGTAPKNICGKLSFFVIIGLLSLLPNDAWAIPSPELVIGSVSSLGQVWGGPVMSCIASIPKNSREEYRVTSEVFKGTPLVHFRVWYLIENEYAPPHKGVAIHADQLPEIIKALVEAESAVSKERAA